MLSWQVEKSYPQISPDIHIRDFKLQIKLHQKKLHNALLQAWQPQRNPPEIPTKFISSAIQIPEIYDKSGRERNACNQPHDDACHTSRAGFKGGGGMARGVFAFACQCIVSPHGPTGDRTVTEMRRPTGCCIAYETIANASTVSARHVAVSSYCHPARHANVVTLPEGQRHTN